jgi:ABC-type nitrate/sulfonate/bicarbonate transport system substrate-binding protein
MNNTPPADGDCCCCAILRADMLQRDRPTAMDITRALMRGGDWTQQHTSETAELMVARLAGAGEEVMQSAKERALSQMAFVPGAESARPVLVDQFQTYLNFKLPVQRAMAAEAIVEQVYQPITSEL